MVSIKSSLLGALALATTALATNAPVSTYCDKSSSVCGGINIPESGTDTFFQVKGSVSSGWAAIGLGNQMAGTLMFVIYPSADGTNVTVSPRMGTGHVEPQHSSNIQLTILEGTGISGQEMTAYFKCSNCRSWGSSSLRTTSKQNFVWASGPGRAIKSDSVTQAISEHADSGNFQLNVALATGGDGSANPFMDSGSSSGTGTSTGSSPSKTGSSSSGNSGGSSVAAPMTKADKVLIAHGVIMAVTWVIFFPLGASFIRLLSNHIPNAFMMHRGFQIFNVVLSIVGMALGMWVSGMNDTHFEDFHQYFGVILIGMLFVQGALGQLHHAEFMRTKKRSIWSYAHIWVGRAVIAGGIFNGGIGLSPDLADASSGQIAAYVVVALLVVCTYTVFFFLQRRKQKEAWRGV